MESITKYRQPPSTLRSIIARAYGDAAVPLEDDFATELGHGWFNVAYILRLRDGREVVLKIAPPPGIEVMTYEEGMMCGEIRAIELIRRETTVPVPQVDHYDDTHTIIDADWFVMPRLPGENLKVLSETLSPDEYQAGWRVMGEMTKRLNGITGAGFGRFNKPLVGTWREAFTGIIGDVLADGERRQVALGWSYAEIRELIADHEACLDEVVTPAFCEWDFWDANAMMHEGRLIGVIDHERAFWADPILEAGFVMAALGLPIGEAFLEGYGERPGGHKGPLTEGEMARRRLYNLHLFLIMTIETSYRGHTTTDQYDFALGRLADVMASFGRTH